MNEPRNNRHCWVSFSLHWRRQRFVVFSCRKTIHKSCFHGVQFTCFPHSPYPSPLSFFRKCPLFGTVYLWIPSILRVTMQRQWNGKRNTFFCRRMQLECIFCWLYFLPLCDRVSYCKTPSSAYIGESVLFRFVQ